MGNGGRPKARVRDPPVQPNVRLGCSPTVPYLEGMQTFVDLAGSSGATYRFHRVVDHDNLPAIAGNFIYVRGEGRELVVICCGTDETLLNAAQQWPKAVKTSGAEAMFVRLNVSRKTRGEEHADIVLLQRPKMIVAAEFHQTA